MPIPRTKNVGKLIEFFRREGKPQKQAVAIALHLTGKGRKKKRVR